MTESHIGKKASEETRIKMSETKIKIGSPWNIGRTSSFKGKHFTNEQKIIISQNRKNKGCGERNGNWCYGNHKVTQERNDAAYKFFVAQVKKRDDGICRLKDENCNGYAIVHHILPWSEYPQERYNINNGITLCQYHHPRKRIDEQRLIPMLKTLVGSY